MAERCPWCGKFRSSWAPNPRQSEWDMMQQGREYICITCCEIERRRTTYKEN